MIICCYTEISDRWSQQELEAKLASLPPPLQSEALRKKQWLDMQLTLAGKLLLLHLLKNLGLDRKLSLTHLRYTEFDRPYFDDHFDFNIAHSGKFALCCGVLNGKVGADIEQTKHIDLDDFIDHFTENEWNKINRSSDRHEKFYTYWTRKEAVLKAIGSGLNTPLSSIDVSGANLIYDEQTYYLRSANIGDGYKCHIATTIKHSKVHLIPVIL